MWCWDLLSAETRTAMRLGQEECDRLEHPYFGGEHLLLGLLAAGHPPAAAWLVGRGVELAGARGEVARIVAEISGPDGIAALRQLGIDLGEVRRRIEANFGPMPVLEATRRVARRPWWRGRRHPNPAWRRPFLVKRALEFARDRAKRDGAPLIRPEHVLYGVLRDARDPVGTGISRRRRAEVVGQIGLTSTSPHPVRLLLAAHGIDLDQSLTDLDQQPRRQP